VVKGKYWETSFTATEKLRDRARAGHNADPDAEAAGDPCSRGPYCSGRRIVTEGSERRIIPARTYGPFCPSCRGLIASCLAELPPAYVRLSEESGEMHRRGTGTHSAFGPRLPFDPSYQELMARIAEALLSFEERVRTVARLSVLDTQLSRRRDQQAAVADAATLLGHADYFSALLALPPEPMMRSVPDRSRPDAMELVEMDGKAAGEEILALHRKALLILGEIVRQRELIDGVPCRRCENISLYRAEPPSDPAKEVLWSECRECHDQMDRKTFEAWAAMYARWSESAGVACRRCRLGRHEECQWNACSCAACEHAAA
jgi:hypothetical protein